MAAEPIYLNTETSQRLLTENSNNIILEQGIIAAKAIANLSNAFANRVGWTVGKRTLKNGK